MKAPLAAAFVLCLPAAAIAQTTDQMIAPYLDLTKVKEADTFCGILNPTQKAGIEAARSAAYLNLPEDLRGPATQAANQLGFQIVGIDCKRADVVDFTGQARTAADGYVDEWLAISAAVLRYEDAHPWAAGMTGLSIAAAPLKSAAADPAGRNSPASADRYAAQLMDAACPVRKIVRSPTPRACPAEPSPISDKADQLLKVAETFTLAWGKAKDITFGNVATPPTPK